MGHLNIDYLQTRGKVHGGVEVKNVGGVTEATNHVERAGTRRALRERDRGPSTDRI